VGTIDIDANDPLLEGADDVVRGMYEASLHRPLMVKEPKAEYSIAGRKKGRRG
jgi:hypothetical protein